MTTETRKAALVTGAAQRIGRAIAEGMAEAGWRVGVHYRSSAREAADLVATLNATHGKGRAQAFEADLTDERQTAALVTRVAQALGPVHALINNASVFEPDTARTASLASWNKHMATNLRAPFVLSQAFALALPSHEQGVIVNILDQRVLALRADFLSYTLSKAALWDLTRMLAQAFAPRIRVNGIGPGPTLASIHQTEQDFASEAAATLLRRPLTPKEIADGVLYVVGADAMTGQMIALDAGQHLMRPSFSSSTLERKD